MGHGSLTCNPASLAPSTVPTGRPNWVTYANSAWSTAYGTETARPAASNTTATTGPIRFMVTRPPTVECIPWGSPLTRPSGTGHGPAHVGPSPGARGVSPYGWATVVCRPT